MSIELPGAAPEHIDLLRQAGIVRVEQLRAADPQSLWNDLAAANDHYNIMESLPSQELVAHWVGVAGYFEEGHIVAGAAAGESERWSDERLFELPGQATEMPGWSDEQQRRRRQRISDSASEELPGEPDEKQRRRRKRKTGNSAQGPLDETSEERA